jgi:hypothetical protein
MVSSTSVFQTPAAMGGMGTDPVTLPGRFLRRFGYSWATVSETEVDCALTPLTVVVPVMGMV